MENEEKAERLIEPVKKVIAGLPQPHDVRTREHFENCDECRQWRRAVEASFEEIEKEEGMMSGGLGMLMFMALAKKANALTTLAGSSTQKGTVSFSCLNFLHASQFKSHHLFSQATVLCD